MDNKNAVEQVYCIRQDAAWALKDLIIQMPEKKQTLYAAYLQFHERLKSLIEQFTSIEVVSVSLDWQEKMVKQLHLQSTRPGENRQINLDLCTNSMLEGQVGIQMCRLFELGGEQKAGLTFSVRPGYTQSGIGSIAPGEYDIIDDDIASGYTVACLQKQLQQHGVRVREKINLNRAFLNSIGYTNHQVFDVIDTRDFLICAKDSGLVCVRGDAIARVPYLWPWVNITSRVNIPDKLVKLFCIEVIKENINFYNSNAMEQHRLMPEVTKSLMDIEPQHTDLQWAQQYLKRVT